MASADELLALSDEDFKAIVDAVVRDPTDSRGSGLRDPRVVDRWYFTLLAAKKSVEGQLAAKKAESAAARAQGAHSSRETAVHERWRAGALRFKAGLESNLLEARALREKANPLLPMAVSERNALIAGIIAHRDHVCGPECDDVCTADEKLWGLVGGPS